MPEAPECDRFSTSLPTLLNQLEAKYKSRGQLPAWAAERENWTRILPQLISHPNGIGFNYRIEKVLGVGGAGAVFRVIDCNLVASIEGETPASDDQRLPRAYRALKIPRPHATKSSVLANSLRDEISRLTALSHPNVVSIFAKGQIPLTLDDGPTTWPWFVMEYLKNAVDLQEYCRSDQPPALLQLIKILFESAVGLAHVHKQQVIHCDIKPDNIFLSLENNGSVSRAVVADFGYAKWATHQIGETTVGFTEPYAHPDLLTGAKVSDQQSRMFKTTKRSELRAAFDLFAFGMSITYLLDSFYKKYSVYKEYSYEIKYLRLCAARLLDGLNHQKDVTYGNLPSYAFRDWGTKGDPDFLAGLRYRSCDQLVLDLGKLLGYSSPEADVPEIIDTRRDNIQVSDSAPAVYTRRLRRVVDHPLVRRLAGATQLGLVSLVYPGATHTRLEHALGTFGVAARYLKALYYDKEEPLFRQLVGPEEMKATLLAALLHDIGQYPLAHDLEDVSVDFFSHEAFGDRLLSTNVPVPPQVRLFPELELNSVDLANSLAEILQESWGLSLADVRGILAAKSTEHKTQKQVGTHVQRLCKSLIDGPIDADKIDYLQRDSRHCGIRYGYGLDVSRLLKCLTTAPSSVAENHLLLVAGVHEKGRVSAESVGFVRYAMLTQVYGHHTMRAMKALLHHATCELLESLAPKDFQQARDAFFRCAVLQEPVESSEWNNVLAHAQALGSIHPGDLRVLGWIWQRSGQYGRTAIQHILDRQLFKRVLVEYRANLTPPRRKNLDKVFTPENWSDRLRLREEIEGAVLTRAQKAKASNELLETRGFSPEEWKERIAEKTQLHCVIDYPALRPGSAYGLQVVSPWGESTIASQRTEPKQPTEQYPAIISTDYFRDGMKELEKSIASFRVFWEPKEAAVLRELLPPEALRRVIMNQVSQFKVSD